MDAERAKERGERGEIDFSAYSASARPPTPAGVQRQASVVMMCTHLD
jgi:hypothetical protein